jgi:hypothetical protein
MILQNQHSRTLKITFVVFSLISSLHASAYKWVNNFVQASEVGMRITEPAKYDTTIYVGLTGNNSNPGTAELPKKTIRVALNSAMVLLNKGLSTKIVIKSGDYQESVTEKKWNSNNAITRSKLLCIEGEGIVTISPAKGQEFVFCFERKDAVILRNITFDGKYANATYTTSLMGEKLSHGLVFGYPQFNVLIDRNRDWLVENCTFKNSTSVGASFHHFEWSTFRNIIARENKSTGINFAIRNCLLEGFTIEHNNLDNTAAFSNGGLSWIGVRSVIRNSTFHNNNGSGFRMDHCSKNVVLENCMMSNNTEGGAMFETAIGPHLIKHCKFENNKNGLIIATAYDFVVDSCDFINNTVSAVQFGPMKRDDPAKCNANDNWYCTAGQYDREPAYKYFTKGDYWADGWGNDDGISGNLRIELCNNTMQTNVAKSKFMEFDLWAYYQPNAGLLENMLKSEYSGIGNKYFCSTSTKAFDIRLGHNGTWMFSTQGDLKAWQLRCHSDSDAVWANANSTINCSPVTIIPNILRNNEKLNADKIEVTSGTKLILSTQNLGGGRWNWEGPDGFKSTENEISVSPEKSSEYKVTFTNYCGSTSTLSYAITLGNINSSILLTDNENQAIKVIPNPANESIMLILPENHFEKMIQIFDNTGKLVFSKNVTDKSVQIDVSKFTSGLYFINTAISGKVYRNKLLKR